MIIIYLRQKLEIIIDLKQDSKIFAKQSRTDTKIIGAFY